MTAQLDFSGLNCRHGVSMTLDADHSCFECEKECVEVGMPLAGRMIDGATVTEVQRRQAQGSPKADAAPGMLARAQAGAVTTPEARARLWAALRGSFAKEYAQDIKGDAGTTPMDMECRHEEEAVALAAELKALQRLFIEQRSELAQSLADTDAFARENFDYVRQLDAMRGRVKQQEDVILRMQKTAHRHNRSIEAMQRIVNGSTEA